MSSQKIIDFWQLLIPREEFHFFLPLLPKYLNKKTRKILSLLLWVPYHKLWLIYDFPFCIYTRYVLTWNVIDYFLLGSQNMTAFWQFSPLFQARSWIKNLKNTLSFSMDSASQSMVDVWLSFLVLNLFLSIYIPNFLHGVWYDWLFLLKLTCTCIIIWHRASAVLR